MEKFKIGCVCVREKYTQNLFLLIDYGACGGRSRGAHSSFYTLRTICFSLSLIMQPLIENTDDPIELLDTLKAGNKMFQTLF